MQCDIKLDVDCTDYQLYFFPDELDAVIFDKIHGRRDMDLSEESQRYPEKAKNAFCVYLDGWVKLFVWRMIFHLWWQESRWVQLSPAGLPLPGRDIRLLLRRLLAADIWLPHTWVSPAHDLHVSRYTDGKMGQVNSNTSPPGIVTTRFTSETRTTPWEPWQDSYNSQNIMWNGKMFNKYWNKFALLWGDAQLCLPYVFW